MPTREQIIQNSIELFETSQHRTSKGISSAWLGIYQVLLWYEPVNWVGIRELPHIIDANNLRPNTPAKQRSWTEPKIWQKRGQAINEYLAGEIGCSPEEVSSHTDQLLKLPGYEDLQRQNILGIAFVGLVKYILEKFGAQGISYQIEVDAEEIFPGITFPGRSGTPRIDLLVKTNDIPRAIVSAKWSLRHDRLNDITNECPVYKAAFERIYRGATRGHLLYYVITNEYNPARLNKVLIDTCVDGVVHVHKPAIIDVCKLNKRLQELLDLVDFVKSSKIWV